MLALEAEDSMVFALFEGAVALILVVSWRDREDYLVSVSPVWLPQMAC